MDEDNPYEVGTIDPLTGEYAKFVEFPAAAQITVQGPGARLAPDLLRVAGTGTDGDGEKVAGWYTSGGEFHAASVAIPSDPFGSERDFWSTFFDYQGRFYYSIKVANSLDFELFRVEAGQTTGPTDLGPTGSMGPTMLPNGQAADPDSCVSNKSVYSLIPQSTYLMISHNKSATGKDSEIYAGDITNLPTIGSCGPDAQARALLPQSNVTPVWQPVATRDMSQVAFLLGQPSQPKILYTVPVDGGAPTAVPGSPRGYTLLQWR